MATMSMATPSSSSSLPGTTANNTTTSSSNRDQAQAPFTPTFVRLGRSVWFTLESAHRRRASDDPSPRAGEALEERVAATGAQVEQLSSMGLQWMAVDGDWSARCTWSDEQWRAFLLTFPHYSGKVFGIDDTGTLPDDEKKLVDTFDVYWAFYASLPGRPQNTPSEGFATIQAAGKRVDEALGVFAARLGDPTEPCHVCGKCALGHKLKRCSRCKLVSYCSQECQKQDWRTNHKRSGTCVPILKQDPKKVDKLVRKRYNELRRMGIMDAKDAMQKARAEYDQDKKDDNNAADNNHVGSQVAAMFGLSAIIR